tara:strand:+ start:647 stop:2197 length:1551 start_codon:yes stop_codon:yes gene_type:complete
MTTAQQRYVRLESDRHQFLDTAVDCSELTLPYLIRDDNETGMNHKRLVTPWQSVGAKAVVTLAAKLMLALLPPQTTFFKLQVKEDKLGEEITPEIKSELDLSFSKMERTIMEAIAATNDRVVVHQALKHLIVGGNALIYMGKDGLKHYPLNRYVVNRDGNGNVIEIVTKERISKELVDKQIRPAQPNNVSGDETSHDKEVDVFTHVRLDNGRWRWHQECYGKLMPGSQSSAPKNASPWLVLRFNTVDGEDYGRGRVEEFLGDFRSLEALSQALVEGSAAAAKVVFLVSPSSTTKPQTLAQAGNGAIVQGRQDDVSVITTGGKTADFATAANLAQQLERRIGEAFLQLNIRQSERTTAEEVRLTQLELEQQLGGLFSLLTVEFLVPYLNRTMLVLQRNGQLPKIPKEYVSPTIVAGVNALGRGQDRESLTTFIGTIAQTLGPEALMKYINPSEAIKRLAAAQGIDYLNLVKPEEQIQQEMAQQQQMAAQQSLVDQAGQLARSPMMDPQQQQEQPPNG